MNFDKFLESKKTQFLLEILLIIFIIFIVCFGILTSCTTTKSLSKSDKTKDSIVIVEKIRIDTIREKIIESKGFDSEINFKCDSSALNQSYKSGGVQYKVIKEKGEIKFIIKKDSSFITEKYKSLWQSKDSLQRVVNKSIESSKIVRKPLFSDFWKIAFFVLLGFWVFGITPLFIFRMVKRLFVPL